MMVGLRGGASMKAGTSVKLNLGAAAAATTWGAVPMAPADPILGITEMFKKDERPDKALLGVGAYRDNNG